jgi:hypothetical protein
MLRSPSPNACAFMLFREANGDSQRETPNRNHVQSHLPVGAVGEILPKVTACRLSNWCDGNSRQIWKRIGVAEPARRADDIQRRTAVGKLADHGFAKLSDKHC